MRAGAEIATGERRASASTGRAASRASADGADVRPIGVEQSNTSIVFDDELVLKVFRALEPGVNPELEMLRFLTAHELPEHRRRCGGWYEYEGRADRRHARRRCSASSPTRRDGWELALEELGDDPEALRRAPAASLGAVTAQHAHRAGLGRRATRRSRPRSPASEALALLTATDRRGDRAGLPRAARRRARWRRSPAAAQDVRERLRLLSQRRRRAAGVIRTHGDYHLGQTLLHADAAG